MASIFSDLHIVDQRYGSFSSSDVNAYELVKCPNCSGSQMAVIAFDRDGERTWLRCVNCKHAAVMNDSIVSPGAKPLRQPAGLPGVELAAWEEARGCLSIGANTAAVMMCRKLLLHIAVAHGLPAKNLKDRSPTFMEAVDHLQGQGLITSKMRPWVDRIKDVGNDANHEITPVTAELAGDVANFTLQLLLLAYELDAIMSSASGD